MLVGIAAASCHLWLHWCRRSLTTDKSLILMRHSPQLLPNAQEVRDGGPQAVGYSVSPVGDHLLSSVVARSLAASSGSGGGGPEPRPGLLPVPRVTFGGGLGPLAAPQHTSAATEPYVRAVLPRLGRLLPLDAV